MIGLPPLSPAAVPKESAENNLQTTVQNHTCEEKKSPLGLLTNQHYLFEVHGVVEGHLEDPLPTGLQVDLNTVTGPGASCAYHSQLFPSGQYIEVFTVNCVTSWV